MSGKGVVKKTTDAAHESRKGDWLGCPGEDARLRGGSQGVRQPPPNLRGRQPSAPDEVLACNRTIQTSYDCFFCPRSRLVEPGFASGDS